MNAPQAIILAAGFSNRMGSDKAGLAWLGGEALLTWMNQSLQDAGWNTVIVLGPHNFAYWECRLKSTILVCNSEPELGKTRSIAQGVMAICATKVPIMITAVDQPRPQELYRRLRIQSIGEDEILVPDRAGRNGHPVVFSPMYWTPLLNLKEARGGLRGLLEDHRDKIRRLPCDPDWLSWDCNTPGAYERARSWFELNQSD